MKFATCGADAAPVLGLREASGMDHPGKANPRILNDAAARYPAKPPAQGRGQKIPNAVNLALLATSRFNLDQHRADAKKSDFSDKPPASGINMTGVWIALGIGALIIILDWHMATKPDETDKRKRRKPLSPVNRKQLRDLFVMTLVAAGAVWFFFS